MRVVLDVNVWISGWLWGGVPGQIILMAENQQITVFVSEPILQELETTFKKAKLQARIQLLATTVDALVSKTQKLSQFCPTTFLNFPLLRDPDDTIILATANAAKANVIVTGDLDLLILSEFQGIPILKPIDFISRYFPAT
ncbi:MAG: putative toxin-antitoxin system toxin component, PIN family [Cyanobacteriota bacterium]|nr:putative toxin-antitoxin system toxin component, PIN family [Cyanobacteriota bacterium]